MLISIIIPAYNVQDYIEECVYFAFAQTYPHIEIICIDNNSTDNTWQKIQALKTEFPNLIIDKQLKPGAPATRNKGLKLAKGEWIQFLDADDLLLPKKIEHQTSIIKKEACFIAGACIKRSIKGNETSITPNNTDIYKALFNTQLGNTCANLWNKVYLNKIDGWAENIKSSQEADLMFRLLQTNTQVIFDDAPLTIVRERESGQISQRNPSEKWVQYFDLRIKMLHWIKNTQPTYYKKEEAFYNDSLFGILRIMAQHDFKKAIQLYEQHLGKTYRPSPQQNHSTNFYLWLYRLFGFKGAEIIKNIVTNTRKPLSINSITR